MYYLYSKYLNCHLIRMKRYLKLKIFTFLITLLNTGAIYAGMSGGKFLTDYDSVQYIPNDNEYNIVIAALKGDYTIVEGLLEKGVNPNSMLEDGTTPLIYAAQSGSFQICKLLVSKGAIINYKPATGYTALIAAIRGGYSQIVEFLIEKGADINLTDDMGRTAFIYAAANGDSIMCEKLLSLNANLSLKDNTGTNALMVTIINRRLKLATMLLEKGIDANTSDVDGVTPMMVAVANNDYDAIELLLKYGADINRKSRHKETVLTIAIEKNDEALVRYIVKKGANVNQKLTLAETPLTIAHYNKHDDFIIEALQDLGARQNAIPDFRRITLGPEFTMNFDDFMAGFNFGTKEYKYNLDLTAGIVFRPFATRVLMHDSANYYFQYWEQRNFVYLGINKNIKLTKYTSKSAGGITIGLKELYTFGKFRGTILNSGNNFLLTPEIGFFHMFFGTQFNVVYQYMNFGLTGVSPHRISITAKFILHGSNNFNANLYRPWN